MIFWYESHAAHGPMLEPRRKGVHPYGHLGRCDLDTQSRNFWVEILTDGRGSLIGAIPFACQRRSRSIMFLGFLACIQINERDAQLFVD